MILFCTRTLFTAASLETFFSFGELIEFFARNGIDIFKDFSQPGCEHADYV